MTNPISESILVTAMIIIGILILFFVVVEAVIRLQQFAKDLTRINREIHRADPVEKHYWLKKRRRLWLSLIPFVPYKCY